MATADRHRDDSNSSCDALPSNVVRAHKTHCEDDFIPLAAQITGDWQRVLDTWEEFRTKHGYYLRVDVEADRQNFLTQALWLTYGRRHLPALLARLAERNLTTPDLRYAAKPFLTSVAMLQSYVNGVWRPQDALTVGRRLMHACDHICRLSIDGQHCGTGFLIRPTIVATAAHVLAALLDERGKQYSDSLKRLVISFFDTDELLFNDSANSANPVFAALHQDWLPHYSPPTASEKNRLGSIDDITGIANLGGPWDLALIRLGTPPRAGLAGCSLHGKVPQRASFGLHVLHHPANALGEPMRLLWSTGVVIRGLGEPSPLRLLHDANTDGGSSGAPCFDDNWNVVALHQAGSNTLSVRDQVNRAVPIYAWASQLDALLASTEEIAYLVHVPGDDGRPTPVFGRRTFQANVRRAMTMGRMASERIFVILGDAKSGKSFSGKLVEELARRAGCRAAVLDAGNSQNDSAFDFTQKLLGALGGALPVEAGLPSGLTSSSRDFRADILPTLIDHLRALVSDKPVWLVLDRLDTCDVAGSMVAQVVEGLLDKLETELPHLNLVLIAWKGATRALHVEELATTPCMDDIVRHLWLALAPAGLDLTPPAYHTLKILIRQDLDEHRAGAGYAPAIAAAANLTTQAVARAHMSSQAKPANLRHE